MARYAHCHFRALPFPVAQRRQALAPHISDGNRPFAIESRRDGTNYLHTPSDHFENSDGCLFRVISHSKNLHVRL